MARFSMGALKPVFDGAAAKRGTFCFGVAFASALLLAACGNVEVQNTQAARELAERAKPPGSVYIGWRAFQQRCAGCHGATATGTAQGPDLLPPIRDMGPRRFVSLVLLRYDWNVPVVKAHREPASMDALIDEVMRRRDETLPMPAWQGEPSVNAYIMDLYAYLTARADGVQGPGRPAR